MDPFFAAGSAQVPVAPTTTEPNQLVMYLKSLEGWLQGVFVGGLQATQVTTAQIDSVVAQNDFVNAGKIFYDTTLNKFYGVKILAGILAKQEFV